jgi:phage/plasmid-like protein (TIGR03299 family)
MSHDISTTNGKPAIAYFGDTPWHGLGTKLDGPATATEAIEAGGLSYDVELKSLWTVDGEPVGNRQAAVRSDTGRVLGVVGRGYCPIQNRDCFNFLDDVAGRDQLRYHTVGALGDGERIWMLAKLPGEIRVGRSDDVTEKFLLLSNSHNGSSALRVFFTPIRVVCSNTLAMAENRRSGQAVSVVHKGRLTAKIGEAQRILGFAAQFYDDLQQKIDRLAGYYPTSGELSNYFKNLYPEQLGSSNRRSENIRTRLFDLFEHGRGQDIRETRLTAWAAFNAVAEFIDYHRSTRGTTPVQRAENRLNSAWFGPGRDLKKRAWEAVLALAV